MDQNLKITINGHNATAQVFTPFNESFVAKMKALDGIWDKPLRCWWVGISKIPNVRAAMREVFGSDDTSSAKSVTLRLTFSEDYGVFRQDATLYGKTLSHATSHNSGGTPGEDVQYLAGRAESGGSSKNWCSIVPSGSVIQLYNVPAHLLDTSTIPPMVAVEVCRIDVNRDALLKERTRLMARIEEIDKLLHEQGDTYAK